MIGAALGSARGIVLRFKESTLYVDSLLLAAIFVVMQVAVVGAGVAFETGPLQSQLQNIDPELLRHHLAQSLWYLHGQPPLWNAIVGLSLKIAHTSWPTLWHLAYLLLGLVQSQALFGVRYPVRTRGRPPWRWPWRLLVLARQIRYGLCPGLAWGAEVYGDFRRRNWVGH